jgi:hypothetical protein
MIVTFRTKAHADIMMFGDIAITLLKLMGHSGTVPSALQAGEVPAAWEHFTFSDLEYPKENQCISEKPWSRAAMNVEQQQALQTHLQAIAEILYEETPAEELKTLAAIEQTVRYQLQQHVMPAIGIFLSSGPLAPLPAIRGPSKACSVNCR